MTVNDKEPWSVGSSWTLNSVHNLKLIKKY